MESTAKASTIPYLFARISWQGKESLSVKLKQIIFSALKESFLKKAADIRPDDIILEHPSYENYGDYSTNIALRLASKIKKQPKYIAEKIANVITDSIKKDQSTSLPTSSKSQKYIQIKPSDVLEKAESASGFINLWLNKKFLITQMAQLLSIKNGSTTARIMKSLPLKDKNILFEFAHPNTHKEFHIGHLRNISLGESLVRILKHSGAEIFRANYQGDVGLHVAKAIWGVKRKLKTQNSKLKDLEELSLYKKVKFLGEGYAFGSKAYQEDKKAQQEIMKLNVFIYKGPKKTDLWQETRRWSLEYFDMLYKRLGSHFDRFFFESEVEKSGRELVINGVKKGVFIKDQDGSIYFPGEKWGINNCVFVTKEGYSTYEGKEIALEELQYKTFPYDLSINNVAYEQSNFFKLSYKATEILFPRHKGRHFHASYGLVNLKYGKLSSRKGKVVTAEWLLNQAKEKIYGIIEQNVSNYNKREKDDIAEKVAVGAVKYSLLKIDPKMDIAFDLEESVSLEGDSGPYLQYTYARCRSVIRKSGKDTSDGGGATTSTPPGWRGKEDRMILNPEELSLLRTLYRFEEVILESARSLSPSYICSFLYDLARKYNLFYNKHSILKPESAKDTSKVARRDSPELDESIRTFRLALTYATAIVVKQGLYLLGIESVEMM